MIKEYIARDDNLGYLKTSCPLAFVFSFFLNYQRWLFSSKNNCLRLRRSSVTLNIIYVNSDLVFEAGGQLVVARGKQPPLISFPVPPLTRGRDQKHDKRRLFSQATRVAIRINTITDKKNKFLFSVVVLWIAF